MLRPVDGGLEMERRVAEGAMGGNPASPSPFGFSLRQNKEAGMGVCCQSSINPSFSVSSANTSGVCLLRNTRIKTCFCRVFGALRLIGSSRGLSGFGLLTCPLRLKRSCLLF